MKKGTVINLRGDKERTEMLRRAYVVVAECSERLRELSVELALKGVWREWSASRPIGTEYSFTYEQMHQTGDGEIDALVALVDNLEDYLDEHCRYKCKGRIKEPLRCESRVMSREEWEERFWPLSDNEWDNLVNHGLVPGSGAAQWRRFEELLNSRQPTNDNPNFTEDEILFLGKMDLVRLGEKFPYAAEYYMLITE